MLNATEMEAEILASPYKVDILRTMRLAKFKEDDLDVHVTGSGVEVDEEDNGFLAVSSNALRGLSPCPGPLKDMETKKSQIGPSGRSP